MFLVDPVAAVATLAAADRAGCDQAALTELVARSLQVRAWLDAFDADLAIRAGQLGRAGRRGADRRWAPPVA